MVDRFGEPRLRRRKLQGKRREENASSTFEDPCVSSCSSSCRRTIADLVSLSSEDVPLKILVLILSKDFFLILPALRAVPARADALTTAPFLRLLRARLFDFHLCFYWLSFTSLPLSDGSILSEGHSLRNQDGRRSCSSTLKGTNGRVGSHQRGVEGGCRELRGARVDST